MTRRRCADRVQPDRCETIGVIHDVATGSPAPHASKHAPLPVSEISMRDTETDLEWATEPKRLPVGYRLCRESRFGLGEGMLLEPPRRAFTLFEPCHLLEVDAYVNPVSGRYGLKALRFQGQAEMGTVLLGDWQERHARPMPDRSMSIDGAHPPFPFPLYKPRSTTS